MLIDTHCHLAHHRFAGEVSAVVHRAHQAGVSAIVAPATTLEDIPLVLSFAEEHPNVFAAVGIHPCDVDSLTDDSWIEQLYQYAQHPKVVAIGEIGLDYFHPPPQNFDLHSWKAQQQHCLRQQIQVARELHKPLILHNRSSWEDLSSLILNEAKDLKGVFHCFGEPPEAATQVIAAGFKISFTGILTFKKPGFMAENLLHFNLDHFMLETDAPYLAPEPFRGQRCEPAHTLQVAQAAAKIKNISLEEIAFHTTQNAIHFFDLPLVSL
jgi:TatD DNase family protein